MNFQLRYRLGIAFFLACTFFSSTPLLSQSKQALQNYEAGLHLARKHKKYTNEIEFLEALKELYGDSDTQKIEGLNHDIEVAQKLQTYFDHDQQKIDDVLAGELRESDKIRKSGFVSESNRWPFYIGASILFAGFIRL